jgi:hypothetical protein
MLWRVATAANHATFPEAASTVITMVRLRHDAHLLRANPGRPPILPF